MRASELTHRIVLQRATETRDAIGYPAKTWTTLAEVWAGIEWASGAETFTGGREFEQTPVTLRLRRSSDTMSLRAKDRALVPQGATTLTEVSIAADTSLVVEDAGVFPPEGDFVVRIGSELVLVTAVSANTLTCTRGAYGTTAAIQAPDKAVVHMAPVDIETVRHTRYEITADGLRSEVRMTT